MGKKTTKKTKEVEQEPVNVVEEVVLEETKDVNEQSTNEQDVTNNIEQELTEKFAEAVESVDFKKIEEEAGIQTQLEMEKRLEEELKPITDILADVNTLVESRDAVLNKVTLETNEEAEKFVKQELEKARALQNKVVQTKKVFKPNNNKFQNFWNGIAYDF